MELLFTVLLRLRLRCRRDGMGSVNDAGTVGFGRFLVAVNVAVVVAVIAVFGVGRESEFEGWFSLGMGVPAMLCSLV